MLIQTNAVESIRGKPNMYFPLGLSKEEVCLRMTADLLRIESVEVNLLSIGNWSAVKCSIDWLIHYYNSCDVAAFHEIRSFPEVGPNTMHAEILLMAFCENLITFSAETGVNVLKGEMAPDHVVKKACDDLEIGRAILFSV